VTDVFVLLLGSLLAATIVVGIFEFLFPLAAFRLRDRLTKNQRPGLTKQLGHQIDAVVGTIGPGIEPGSEQFQRVTRRTRLIGCVIVALGAAEGAVLYLAAT
jgi:hypothetical protein